MRSGFRQSVFCFPLIFCFGKLQASLICHTNLPFSFDFSANHTEISYSKVFDDFCNFILYWALSKFYTSFFIFLENTFTRFLCRTQCCTIEYRKARFQNCRTQLLQQVDWRGSSTSDRRDPDRYQKPNRVPSLKSDFSETRRSLRVPEPRCQADENRLSSSAACKNHNTWWAAQRLNGTAAQ